MLQIPLSVNLLSSPPLTTPPKSQCPKVSRSSIWHWTFRQYLWVYVQQWRSLDVLLQSTSNPQTLRTKQTYLNSCSSLRSCLHGCILWAAMCFPVNSLHVWRCSLWKSPCGCCYICSVYLSKHLCRGQLHVVICHTSVSSRIDLQCPLALPSVMFCAKKLILYSFFKSWALYSLQISLVLPTF